MLDTDICSYVLKEKPVEVLKRFDTVDVESLCISAITQAELQYGAERKQSKKLNTLIGRFLSHITVLPWPNQATVIYAKSRHRLNQVGTPIGNMDLLIASHAIAIKAVLVTNSVKHFARVDGLHFENWVGIA